MPYKQKTAFWIIMNEKGYTTLSLADAVGIHFRTIEKLSQGRTDPARMQAAAFLAIARAFGMDPYELMELVRYREVLT